MKVTMFDVEGRNLVGLVGVNTALSECEPLPKKLTDPTAFKAATAAAVICFDWQDDDTLDQQRVVPA